MASTVFDMINFQTNMSTMRTLNVAEAKTHFSSLVDEAEEGSTILICRRNIPVAQLTPHYKKDPAKRHQTKIGWAKSSGISIQGNLTEPALPESAWDMLR